MTMLNGQTGLLAEGWGELIGVLVLFGFYAIGALAKWASKRSGDNAETEKPSRAVELAKKYAQQRRQQVQSEWDRMQAAKRRRLEQMRGQAQKAARPEHVPKAAKGPVVHRQMPKAIPVNISPEYDRAADIPKAQPVEMPVHSAQPHRVQQQSKRRTAAYPMGKIPRQTPKYSKKIATTARIPKISTHPLDVFTRQPAQLRSAIILKEILDKPVALREDW